MNRKSVFMKMTAVSAAVVFSLSFFSGIDTNAIYEDEIYALEQQMDDIAARRAEVESLLSEYEDNVEEQEAYLAYYDEKMSLQEQEISNVKEQIELLNEEISDLEVQIADKEAELEQDIEDFKQRLRSMYMSGNDSLASVLTGATDFYDILARMELIQRVSKHDNEMIDELTAKITSLNEDKESLEAAKNDAEEKKAEQEQILADLRETYQNHSETKAWYEAQAAGQAAKTDEMKAEEAQAEEELQAYIRLQQEELERQRQEEEERKRKEEEERKRQEEEERKRQEELAAQQNQSDDTEDTSTESTTDTSSGDSSSGSTSSSASSSGFIWPCPNVLNYTDTYGYRTIDEEGGASDFHKGIDITKPGCYGETIVASAAGTVIQASDTGNGYGNCVIIDHGNGISTLYAHMSSCAVSVGDYVSQGQTIGYIGSTGYAYGNHCHFEVRVNGQHTDPFNYVSCY